MPGNWKQLLALAQEEVTTTLASLPAEISGQARSIPVSFEERPDADLVAEGIEPDSLGLFQGEPFGAEDCSPIPAHITLYLANLWEFSGADEAVFREELRVTLLHELGHYLGLDEEDLFDRGLE